MPPLLIFRFGLGALLTSNACEILPPSMFMTCLAPMSFDRRGKRFLSGRSSDDCVSTTGDEGIPYFHRCTCSRQNITFR